LTPTAIERGLRNANLPGRFQRIAAAAGFEWVLDVAHNPDSARVLARTLRALRRSGARSPCGMLADKDVEVVEILRDRVDDWIAAGTDGPRALDDAALAARAGARGVVMASAAPCPRRWSAPRRSHPAATESSYSVPSTPSGRRSSTSVEQGTRRQSTLRIIFVHGRRAEGELIGTTGAALAVLLIPNSCRVASRRSQ
jgi:hypothetical protein